MVTGIKFETPFDPLRFGAWMPATTDGSSNSGNVRPYIPPGAIGQCVGSYTAADKKPSAGQVVASLPILTEGEFQTKALGSQIPAIVLLSAPWCKPCPVAKEALLRISRLLGDKISFYVMNYDSLSENFRRRWNGSNNIPMVMIFKGGTLRGSLHGAPPITPEEEKTRQIAPEKIQKYAGRLLEMISSKLGISISQ